MNAGGKPAESRAFRKGRPCPFPEGGLEVEGKRRGEAPIGAPVRVMGRPFPSAGGTGPTARRPRCGVPHSACRRFAPSVRGDILQTPAGRPLPRSDETWLTIQRARALPSRAGVLNHATDLALHMGL